MLNDTIHGKNTKLNCSLQHFVLTAFTTYMFIKFLRPWKRFAIVSSDCALYKSVTNRLKWCFKRNTTTLHIYDDMRTNAHAWEIDRTFRTITKEARSTIS